MVVVLAETGLTKGSTITLKTLHPIRVPRGFPITKDRYVLEPFECWRFFRVCFLFEFKGINKPPCGIGE